MSTLYARNPITGKFEKVGRGLVPTDQTLTLQGIPADAKAVGDAIRNVAVDMNNKANKITGTAGDFVVIGKDGNLTAKALIVAEEAIF